jgi:Histidine kinase
MSTAPELNRLQRWYFGWAEKYYLRLPPEAREQARAIDRLLYSRRGWGVWLGFGLATAACTIGLHAAGASWIAAALLSFAILSGFVFFALGGWLAPERFSARKMWGIAGMMMLGTYAGALSSILVSSHGDARSATQWLHTALAALWRATPFQLMAGLGMVLVAWAATAARRQYLQRELQRTRLEQERDAAACELAEARLTLLQAQIQPHFLFNTLAALQHWVDVGDARAAPLLRSLTSFLRGSTELMMKPEVTLGEECEMVAHYVAIMQARLGERLRWRVDIAPECAAQALPPGLLITLVENAIEHGIEPQLRGGEVSIVARIDAGSFDLRVLDDGAGLRAAEVNEGVGLANSRERLRHQFGARATLSLRARDDGPGAQACLRLLGAD